MNDLIRFAASDLLYVVAIVFAVIWLVGLTAAGRLGTAIAAVLGLAAMGVLIPLLAHLYVDPRPFVQNPSLHPLIAHNADNGFPSDHSAAAALLAGLIAWRRRLIGAGMAILAVAIGASRVAAHVHHVQDVIAGLGIGAISAGIGIAISALILARFPALTSLASRWSVPLHRSRG